MGLVTVVRSVGTGSDHAAHAPYEQSKQNSHDNDKEHENQGFLFEYQLDPDVVFDRDACRRYRILNICREIDHGIHECRKEYGAKRQCNRSK